ncbi:hypothetical protein FYJ85_22590 [Victivallaceae bacterium BBE-744-WT-12]|uniref:Carboxypeptidase family protein n=1 Tax=Victivallis lenta TaxID=2606640 RepID=A0A844G7B1_9BACT|nr:hypothetical protein [Victivallis lenta]MST99820.1 hypothetical protein [Victivallis lenta]
MKIAVVQLLSLLLFIIGLSVYADETSLEGAYIWTLKSPDGNEFVEKIYFKNINNKLMLYLEGEQYECSLSGTHFSGQMYIQKRVRDVSGGFQSDGKIIGKQERWDVFTPEEKVTLTFEAVRDTSEEAQKFWPQYLQEWEAHLASLDKKPDWDATEAGRHRRDGLLALAAEQHVTLKVRGKVVDSTGKPLPGIVLCCGTQRIDINYSMGLATTEDYITTNSAGEFETKELTAWALFLFYGGKKYQEYSADFENKEQLLELQKNPITITLLPIQEEAAK